MTGKQTQTRVNVLTAEGSDSIIDQIVRQTEVDIAQLDRIDKRLANYRSEEASYGELMKAVARAELIYALADALEPFMPTFMKLKNSKLGFLTDEGGRQESFTYSLDKVRDCIVDALLMGLHPIGNEFNIIGGNMYATKDGLWRLCNQLPKLSDLQTFCDPPAYDAGARKVVVVAWAKYLIDGEEKIINHKIPIRINKGMGDDAIIGKATRKILERVYKTETGRLIASSDLDDDGEDEEAPTKTAADLIGKTVEKAKDAVTKVVDKSLAAKKEKAAEAKAAVDFANLDQVALINEWAGTLNWSQDKLRMRIAQQFDWSLSVLTSEQADRVILWMKEQAGG
jgi:hypothetical protein